MISQLIRLLYMLLMMGLCSDSAERGCSFSFIKEQRRDCISPDKINLVVQQSPVRYIKLHSLKYLDSSVCL